KPDLDLNTSNTTRHGARRERPRCRSAAEQRDELASDHSITLSARASSVGGMVRSSAFAVLMLMLVTSFVENSTGRSAGLLPFRILSTQSAAREGFSESSTPKLTSPPASTNRF